MSWEHELDAILHKLGVEQEASPAARAADEGEDENPFIMSQSVSRPGVSYRLDLVNETPEMRVYIASNEGAYKMRIYLVKLAKQSFLLHLLRLILVFEGGPAFEAVEGCILFHMLNLLHHTMVEFFWLGDPNAEQFPPEIEVRRLL